jgi:hypothetical protein
MNARGGVATLATGGLLVAGLVTCTLDLGGSGKETPPPKCLEGWLDCDGDPTTGQAGCETNVTLSVKHCGACGHPCPTGAFAVTECRAGVCQISCTSGALDCNQNPEDGCEVNPLSDPKNCGGCGHDCLGGTCAAGKCQPAVIADDQSYPYGIALDGANVYFTSYEARTVSRLSKSGGAPEVVATSTSYPLLVAADDRTLYWAGTAPNQFERAPKVADAGADATPDGAAPLGQLLTTNWGSFPRAIALGGGRAYFTVYSSGYVAWVDQSNPSTYGIVDYQVNTGQNLLALDGTNVYWTSFITGAVHGATQDGGAPFLIDGSSTAAYGIVVDDDFVYWTQTSLAADGGGSAIVWKWKKDGSRPKVALTGIIGNGLRMVADAKNLYFATSAAPLQVPLQPQPFRIVRVAKDEDVKLEGPEFLFELTTEHVDLAVDDTSIYWSASGHTGQKDGRIYRLAK